MKEGNFGKKMINISQFLIPKNRKPLRIPSQDAAFNRQDRRSPTLSVSFSNPIVISVNPNLKNNYAPINSIFECN